MDEGHQVSNYLAENILSLRKKRGFSQGKLSEMAEIPRSTITHMESGEGNPSLNNLCKISAALQVSIEELLSRPRSDCTLIRAPDVPFHQHAKGKVKMYKMMPDTIRGIEIDRLEMQANTTMAGQPHLQGTKEYLMPIAGEITVFVAGARYTVGEGDVFAFQGDQPHSYKNSGGRHAVALSVVLPVPP